MKVFKLNFDQEEETPDTIIALINCCKVYIVFGSSLRLSLCLPFVHNSILSL